MDQSAQTINNVKFAQPHAESHGIPLLGDMNDMNDDSYPF